MDFKISQEQQMMLDTIRTMAKRENFRELAMEIERTGEYPHHLVPKFAEMGLLGMTLNHPPAGGQPTLSAALAIEELAKSSAVIATSVFESNLGPIRVIDMFGTMEQKERLIPGVCRGEHSMSVCMTEPEAGSDLTSLRTSLRRNGDKYLLNGRKVFTSGGGEASHYLVYARFNDTPGYKGIGAVIVEKGAKGLSFGKQEDFMGLRGMPSSDVVFDEVEISEQDIVLREGDFKKLMLTFDIERCGNASMCLGIAGGALEEAKNYAQQRNAFGRPICEFQAVQFMISEMAMQLDAARLLVYRAATGAGQGPPSIYEASMAKCFANEMVKEVTDKAIQVLGGYGYSREFPVERMYRDGRAWSLAGGTVQILRITMASMIFGRSFDQRK
jgi:butyryl-CoA dehydrogenase